MNCWQRIRCSVRLRPVWKKFYDAIRGNRLAAVLAALLLVALPTVFALFPALTVRLNIFRREMLMLGWLIVAIFTVVASQTRESEKDARAAKAQDTAQASQRLLLRQYLTVLLNPRNTQIPATYEISIYIRDTEADLLFPWFPTRTTNRQDPTVFEYRQGATGTAFVERKAVVAVGDAVSSGEYGLTEAQQRRYADYVIVAAVPIRLLGGQLVGVLGAISKQNDGRFSSSDAVINQEGIGLLEELADRIGEVLGMEGLTWQA